MAKEKRNVIMSAAVPLSAQATAETRKHALEALLLARRLQKDASPLRGEDRRLCPLTIGVPRVDALIGGGFPRGQLSELHGTLSSGRTGLVLALVARVNGGGGMVAFVDPLDRLDPSSAAAAGVDLTRLLWLRGPRDTGEQTGASLADATATVATLAGSGLFELVIFDVVGATRALRSLPATTWLRLQRLVEGTATALVVLADGHVARSPLGVSLALESLGPRWSGAAGPSRLLEALRVRARSGRHATGPAELVLPAVA